MVFSYQIISQRTIRTALENQLSRRGPNASRGGGGSMLIFLRKPISTKACNFQGGQDPLTPPLLDPSTKKRSYLCDKV